MILVTGATGYLGHLTVKSLIARGHKVRALVVKNDPFLGRLEGTGCEIVEGDITASETLKHAFDSIQTVIHLAAVMVSHNKALFHKINYDGTKNVVETAVGAGVEHFIYISAAAANYNVRTDYGVSKYASEQLMQKRGKTNFTIIRPTLIYGDNGGQEFTMYLRYLNKFPLFIPLIGSGRARKRMVWVYDIIDGLTKCVGSKVSYGRLYNFSGGSSESMREITRLLCKRFNVRKILIPVPIPIVYVAAWCMRLFSNKPPINRNIILGVTMDADFGFEAAKRDIGYDPVTFEEGLNREFC